MESKKSILVRFWGKIKNNKTISIIITLIIIFVFYQIYEIIILGWNDWILINGFGQIWEIKADPLTNIPIEKKIHYRTLWDVLELVIIPAVLAIAAYWFSKSERKNEQDIALDRQRETTLQNYIDRMTELLLKEKLLNSNKEDVIQTVARILTTTTLRTIDVDRKRLLIRFIYEAELLYTPNPIVSLRCADLNNADFSYLNLNKIDLGHTYLDEALFFSSDLHEANLFAASLDSAILSSSYLYKSTMIGAQMISVDLQNADLNEANLEAANLTNANLKGAFLSKSILIGTILKNADLSGANLLNTKMDPTQLLQAKSLEGATMPDGRIYDPSIPLEEYCIKPNP